MQKGLASRISDFHEERYYFHNTYLEILVRYGLLGLGLYLWMVADLFRVGRKRHGSNFSPDGTLLDGQFRAVWPLMVLVYLMNGSFVGMNYQFVNGFLFALAGMLVAQNRLHSKEPMSSIDEITTYRRAGLRGFRLACSLSGKLRTGCPPKRFVAGFIWQRVTDGSDRKPGKHAGDDLMDRAACLRCIRYRHRDSGIPGDAGSGWG